VLEHVDARTKAQGCGGLDQAGIAGS
jgi:hypothetical protein